MTYKLKPDSPEKQPLKPISDIPTGDSEKKRTRLKDAPKRMVSLDAFRGFIMILLAAEGFGLAALASINNESVLAGFVDKEWAEAISFHFDHPPWQSQFLPGETDATIGNPWLRWKVSFWDLIQPSFMFMVGVAMPFSYSRREAFGQSAWKRTLHALIRAIVLVLLGVFLYSLEQPSTNWIFPNVLAQIGLGYFFAYLLLGKPLWAQWTALAVILIGTWIGIHVSPADPNYEPTLVNASFERGEIFAEPYAQWSKNGNAFHTFDVWFLNKFPRPDGNPFDFNRGGYSTLNFVPSIATTLLGILCGQLLLSPLPNKRKLSYLLLFGLACWAMGVIAGASCCPIVKRIWTPAWVLFSGGYVIWMLAFFFVLFDMLPFKKLAFPLVVIGMNSLAVYLMGELLRHWFVTKVMMIHFGWVLQNLLAFFAQQTNLIARLNVPPEETGVAMYQALQPVVDPISAFIIIWLIAYYLYRQRIFFRI